MFSNQKTMKYTKNYYDLIKIVKEKINNFDIILVGAGAGLSSSAGFTYSKERFFKYFSDFHKKYGIQDMYSGGFYPFDTLEEYWAFWSRYIFINRYKDNNNETYSNLLKIIKDKDYFVITTNVDHLFQKAGIDKTRLFYTQGDYGLFQCSIPCHNETFDNKEQVIKMVKEQKDMKIPSYLIPKCPYCNKPLTMNLRQDDTFVEDEGWNKAYKRYEKFLNKNKDKQILFLELGVGYNTPSIIKYPFWQMTFNNKNSFYCSINNQDDNIPLQIQNRAILLKQDIKTAINDIL